MQKEVFFFYAAVTHIIHFLFSFFSDFSLYNFVSNDMLLSTKLLISKIEIQYQENQIKSMFQIKT